jgi:hypothetical protein
MTESDWHTCTDPVAMLTCTRTLATDRKLRLFAIAWAQRCYRHMEDERSRIAVDVARDFVEGRASKADLTAAFRDANELCEELWRDGPAAGRASRSGRSNRGAQQSITAAVSARTAADPAWNYRQALRSMRGQAAVVVQYCGLFRCIFGPLAFHSIAITSSWITATVAEVASAIYQEEAFERLPILADALEEAGCNQQDILGHLRSSAEHVRGCWAVDLLLGKA